MGPTRRFWVLVALGTGSAVLAVLFADTLLLGIPIGIGAWLLVEQQVFSGMLTEFTEEAPLRQTLSQDAVLVDEAVTLEIRRTSTDDRLAGLDATLKIPRHPALTIEAERGHALPAPATHVSAPVRVDVAGSYEISPPTITVTSHHGLFQESLSVGNACSLTGDPRVPHDIHVGTGGERIAVSYGEHDALHGGSGFEPGELREYLPGDPTNRIDWKATARLGDPYVREFETKSTRQTHLIIDQRNQMQTGPQGLTKLDYAREIGIWLTNYIANLNDPLGLTVIGDGAIVGTQSAESTPSHYRQLRRELLEVTTATREQGQHHFLSGTTTQSGRDRRVIARKLGSDTDFDQTLQPYFQHANAYREQVTTDPLFKSVQSRFANHTGDSWLVIVTDDTNRAELLETTQLAAAEDTHISVFLLPTVLFDSQAFTDLEAAYTDYRDVETFRQQLAAPTNSTAFEVGPRDRLASLLAAAPDGRAPQ